MLICIKPVWSSPAPAPALMLLLHRFLATFKVFCRQSCIWLHPAASCINWKQHHESQHTQICLMTLYTPRHYFVTHTNIPTLSCFVANLYSVNFLAAKSLLVLLSSKQTNNTHREMNALLIITKFTVGLILLPCLLLGPFFPVFLPLLDNFDSSEKKTLRSFSVFGIQTSKNRLTVWGISNNGFGWHSFADWFLTCSSSSSDTSLLKHSSVFFLFSNKFVGIALGCTADVLNAQIQSKYETFKRVMSLLRKLTNVWNHECVWHLVIFKLLLWALHLKFFKMFPGLTFRLGLRTQLFNESLSTQRIRSVLIRSNGHFPSNAFLVFL